MKIIHTSDWHLGQHFYSKSRSDEHQAFIDWLLKQVVDQQVDAVIIAGDIFDTGTPPSYARELYNQFVMRMAKCNCQLYVLGGNHDSVSTLNESKGLLNYLDIQVIANVTDNLEDQLHIINDKQGEPSAILCAIPFIRPRDVLQSQAGQSNLEKQSALSDAIAQHYAALFALAETKKKELGAELPIIATGHLTAIGATTSDSVRDIYIGTLEAFPANAFPPADYIALGHIHRPQKVAKSGHIRYSGSPIPLSFDELSSDKQVLMVDFSEGKLSQVTSIPVPLFQPMQVIRGDLDSVELQFNALKEYKNELPIWLSIEIEQQTFYNDMQDRVRDMLLGINAEVICLKRIKTSTTPQLQLESSEVLAELEVQDVFEKRLAVEPADTEIEQQQLERVRHLFSVIYEETQQQGDEA